MENTEVKEPELDLDDDLLDLDTDLGGELDLNLDMEPAGPDDLDDAPDPGGAISLDDFGSSDDGPEDAKTQAGAGDSIAVDAPEPEDLQPHDDLIPIDSPDAADLSSATADLPDLDPGLGDDFDTDLTNDLGSDLDDTLGDDLGSDLLDDGLGDDLGSSLDSDLGDALGDDLGGELGDDLPTNGGDLGDLGGLGDTPDDMPAFDAPADASEASALDMAADEGEITLSDSELGNIVGDEELTKIMDSSGDDIPMGEAAEPMDSGLDDLSSMDDLGAETDLGDMDMGSPEADALTDLDTDDMVAEPDMEMPGLDDIGGGDAGQDIVEVDSAGELPELDGAEELTSDEPMAMEGAGLMDADALAMDDDEPTTLSESEIDNILGDDFSLPEDEPLPTGDAPAGSDVDDNGTTDGIPEVYDLESPDFEVIEGEVPGEDDALAEPDAGADPGLDDDATDSAPAELPGDALAATDDLDFAMDDPTAEAGPEPDSALPELDDIDESAGLDDEGDGMVTLPGEADLGDDLMPDDLADQVVTSEPGGDLVADVPDAISDLEEGTALPGDGGDPLAGMDDLDGLGDMDDAPPVAQLDEDSAPLDLSGSDEEIDLLEDVPDEALVDGGDGPVGFDIDDDEDEGPIALSQDELDNIMGDVETEDMPEDYTPGGGDAPGAMDDSFDDIDVGGDHSGGMSDDLFDDDFEDEGPIALSEDELSNIVGDINMDEAEEVEGVAPPSEDDIYQPEVDGGEIVEEDLSDYGEAPLPPATEPAAEKSAEISPERVDNLIEGTSIGREDMRKMLGYLDGLFDMLPDAAIQAFSKSEYFDLYKNIMNDLDL